MRMLRDGKMRSKLVVSLAAAVFWNSIAIEAKVYPDGACPVFALLPFTSMYVLAHCARGLKAVQVKELALDGSSDC